MAETLQILVEYIEKNVQAIQSVQKNLAGIDTALAKTSQQSKTTGADVASMQKQMASRVALLTQKYAEQDKTAQTMGQNTKMAFTEINSAIMLAERALRILKQGYDFAREGAELDFTAGKFERLAENIGTTSDVLMNDLKVATRGIYSDMELMASVTDFVALGLAKDHEEAIRLSRVAAGLNMNMNQLVLTLTNMTTMRFDAIGVRVDGFKERLKGLEDQGYDTNDAFKEAFLQQAEQQLLTVGEAADSSLGSFMRLEAGLKNWVDTAKKSASEAFAPLADNLADVVEENNRLVKYGEIAREHLKGMTGDINITSSRLALYARELANNVEATSSFDRALMNNKISLEETTVAVEELITSNKDMLGLTGKIADENERSADKLADISEKMADNRAEAEKLYPWQIEKIAELDEKYSDLQQAYTDESVAHEERTNRILYDLLLQKLSMDDLTGAEFEVALQAGLMFGVFDEKAVVTAQNMDALTKAVLDGKLEIDDMRVALDGLPKNIPIDIFVKATYASSFDKKFFSGQGFADGTKGWQTVPPGYPQDTYPIGLTSGEKFAVVPAGAASDASGGANALSGNRAMPTNNAREMATIDDRSLERLARLFETAVQRIMN